MNGNADVTHSRFSIVITIQHVIDNSSSIFVFTE